MEYKLETRCLHTDFSSENEIIHPLSVPIYQTATFVHTKIGKYGAYDYTRESNPTRKQLEEKNIHARTCIRYNRICKRNGSDYSLHGVVCSG